MSLEFKYFRFYDQGDTKTNMSELNKLLENGWYPVRETNLTPFNWPGSFALILLERRKEE